VDTGSPFNYLPEAVAKRVNSGWTPPAIFDEDAWAWIVDCGAKAPPFGYIVGGTQLMVEAEDMMMEGGVGAVPKIRRKGNWCLSTVQQSGAFAFDKHILGSPFLKGHLAVFDIGAAEMRFAKRLR
jgi:hypothetical protein